MALDFRVRVAWVSDPFDPAPTWTDVSTYVEVGSASIDITRGQGDLDDSVNPGSLSLTFNNKDGRFTPGYTGGAYYPNVVLGKRIQVHSTTNGIAFTPRFDGFLDTLPMQWAPSGRYAEAQVTAVDRLKKLGKQLFTDNIISTYIRADNPVDYWTMGDVEGTTSPSNTGSAGLAGTRLEVVRNYGANPAMSFGSNVGPSTDGLTAMTITDSALGNTTPTYQYSPSSGLTMETYYQSGPMTNNASPVFLVDRTGTAYFLLSVNLFGDNTVALLWDESALGGSFGQVNGLGYINDGLVHHLAAVYDPVTAGGLIELFVDGVSQGGSSGLGSPVAPTYFVTRIGAVQTGGTTTIAHAAVFNSVLSSTQIRNHALSGVNGFLGETAAARFTRLSSIAGVTPVVTGSFGSSSMGPLQDVEGRSLLDFMQETQDTENGAMFVTTSGSVQLVGRPTFYNQATAVTLSNGQYGVDLAFLADDSRLVNDAAVTDGNGVTQRLQNATSITANGTYSANKTLNTANTNEALAWAQWQINVASTISARCPQVTVDLLTQQSLLTSVQAVEIGNRIDLTGLPTGAPASSVSLQVAGYTESYSVNRYAITFNTVPFITTGLFTLNDATLGKLNTGGILGY